MEATPTVQIAFTFVSLPAVTLPLTVQAPSSGNMKQGVTMGITQKIAHVLGEIDRSGDFFTAGSAELLAPSIEVEGVGRIALPLLPAQVKPLIKVATHAPYGRGSETIVDTDIRRTWQIEAERVVIEGKHWPRTFSSIVTRAAEGLGVSGTVTAELYKMLVYEKGSFFVGHRDTEKAPGMFATLVIALPSQSQGGELVVRHNGREAKLDLQSDDPAEIAFAAFYTDCVHEVLPVTAGCRLTLVFNLVRRGRGAAPLPPVYDAEVKRVKALLRSWAGAKSVPPQEPVDEEASTDELPEKIVYPLEHAYTPAELAFDALKGTDAAVAKVLAVAAPDAGCDLHLALLRIWESGTAEYSGGWRRRYGRSWNRVAGADEDNNGDEFEVVEVYDTERLLIEWRHPDNTEVAFSELPLEDGEVAPPNALDGIEPDEQHFREATGNEGASFERTYARAALVIWPRRRILAIINQAGPAGTLPYLNDLIDQWQAAGPKKGRRAKQQAFEMAGLMLESWPSYYCFERHPSAPTETGRMFQLLTRLGEPHLVERMLERLAAEPAHASADNAALVDAIGLLSDAAAADGLAVVVAAHGIDAFDSCAAMLRGALEGSFAGTPALLRPAAEALVVAFPGDPDKAPKDQWGRSMMSRPNSASLADAVSVSDRVNTVLAKRLAKHVLAWPKHFGLDAVVIPAVKRLLQSELREGPGFKALHRGSIAHLEQRTAEPLEAPHDWTRPRDVRCDCEHCLELSVFLADPIEESWMLRAAKQIRTHVEDTIRRARVDVDCETLRRGSPHTLICTKNQNSYQRRVVQRKQDIADLAVLRR